jgi:hypothetical protein
MEIWDPNEWQGRSEERVNRNAKIVSWSIIGIVIGVGLIAMYYVLMGKI